MSDHPIIPVVLSGGSGVRLWPLSRPDAPKQLLPIVDERSMLLATLERLAGLAEREAAIVVCNAAHIDDVYRDLDAAGEEGAKVIVEPFGRNTAPAVAAAALSVGESDPILLVLPADHLIRDEEAFRGAVADGARSAAEGNLVTFGIVPTYAATGYGYIRAARSGSVRPVDEFIEKPDRTTAEAFLQSGEYLWNSGMFMFRASRYRRELARHTEDVLDAVLDAVREGRTDAQTLFLDTDAFERAESISIDYAVMEHTDNAVVVPLDAGWTDVGSWASLFEVGDRDTGGNVTTDNVITHDVTGSYLRSEGPLVAVGGVADLVVVAAADAVLVIDRHHAEDVRALVDMLQRRGRPEAIASRGHTHAWGRWCILSEVGSIRVEQVEVEPGATAPAGPGTWLIVAGSGAIDEEDIGAGASVRIDDDERRALRNTGETTLVALAVRPGSG